MNVLPSVKARFSALVSVLVMIAGPLLMTFAAVRAEAGAIRALTTTSAVGARASMFGTIDAGDNHTCILAGDGAVRCWGENVNGQLGDGTTQLRALPVTVVGLPDPVSVSAGGLHTCALMNNGTVRCWGYNANGQLGDGTRTTRLIPVTVSGVTDAVALSAGRDHTCAVRAGGTLVCWGANSFGQVGNGTPGTDALAPVAVASVSNARSVAAGGVHTCALIADGTVRCWGSNGDGQLGSGTTTPVTLSDVSGLSGIAALHSGTSHSCGLRVDGSVVCWGGFIRDAGGGAIQYTASPTPFTVSGLNDAAAFAGGGRHACAVRATGAVACWGGNFFGQLGSGTFTAADPPVAVTGITNVAMITAGNGHSCALLANGRVACWGNNASGQLGDGSTASTQSAVLSAFARLTTATHLGSSGSHTCAVRADGPAACWGSNSQQQLGNLSTVNSPNPVGVATSQNWLKVVGGAVHSCALRADGAVLCWGAGPALGDGVGSSRGNPTPVAGVSTAIDVASGPNHACALLVDGTARCWGVNTNGQLGDGQPPVVGGASATPRTVVNLADAVEVSSGSFSTCARRVNGTVQCWGSASNGALGNGAVSGNQSTPSDVLGLANAIAVEAGASHACALRADGLVRCWGRNSSGQLGDGTTNSSALPVPVAPIASANAIELGNSHSCAMLFSGVVRCWGDNSQGQLGDGTTTTPRLSPVVTLTQLTIPTGPGQTTTVNVPLIAVGITAGGSHTCALASNGAPWCWGDNDLGQAGTGGFSNSSNYAREVASFSFNIFPSVTVRRPGRIATITALLTCEEGRDAVVELKLTQGETTARAQRRVSCLNGLERYPVDAPTLGAGQFVDGPAFAEAEVVIYERGQPIEEQRWQRQVTVSRVQ